MPQDQTFGFPALAGWRSFAGQILNKGQMNEDYRNTNETRHSHELGFGGDVFGGACDGRRQDGAKWARHSGELRLAERVQFFAPVGGGASSSGGAYCETRQRLVYLFAFGVREEIALLRAVT
jgi:hypothetical protein